jgi:hypothetical protein
MNEFPQSFNLFLAEVDMGRRAVFKIPRMHCGFEKNCCSVLQHRCAINSRDRRCVVQREIGLFGDWLLAIENVQQLESGRRRNVPVHP